MLRDLLKEATGYCWCAIGLLLVLPACQTSQPINDEQLKAELAATAVAVPPRNPFMGFSAVPTTLEDIEVETFCSVTVDEPTEEWAQRQIELLRENKGDGTHYGRRIAEKAFHQGWPVEAASFIQKVRNLSQHDSDKFGADVFLATFQAGYGDYSKAASSMRIAESNISNHRILSCKARQDYWLERGRAYIALSNGENTDVLSHTARARNFMSVSANAVDTICYSRSDVWRHSELHALDAEALIGLGNLPAAETSALEAIKQSGQTPWSRGGQFYIQSLHLLSRIKALQQRYDQSISFGLMAKKAQDQACVRNSSPARARNDFHLALSLAAVDRLTEARGLIDQVEQNLKQDPVIWRNLFEFSVERGLVLLETGSRKQAHTVFRTAHTRLIDRYGSSSYYTQEAGVLALLTAPAIDRQALDAAVRDLVSAWKEQFASDTGNAASGSFRMRRILEDYLEILFENPDSKADARTGFELAETLRSGTVQAALVQTALRRLAPDEATRTLIREQQDTDRKARVLRQRLEEVIAVESVSQETIENLRSSIRLAEATARQLEQGIRAKIPEYDSIAGAAVFEVGDATGSLREEEALIATFIGREHTYVWALRSDGRLHGHKVRKTLSDWQVQVDELRQSITPAGRSLTSLDKFNTDAAHGMYADLLAPSEEVLESAKHLIFSTDSILSQMPLSMLLTERVASVPFDPVMFKGYADMPWLIKKYAVSNVPSVSAITFLRKANSTDSAQYAFLGVGDPVFDPTRKRLQQIAEVDRGLINLRATGATRSLFQAQLRNLPPLPETADEVLAIADLLQADRKRDVFTGLSASEAKLRALNQAGQLRKYRVVSFATHGLVANDLDGLRSPALALSAPGKPPQGPWDDGLLTAEEIMELDLNADWVALSACNTGSTSAYSQEGYSGLGLAFFYAGAKSIMLSHWPVMSASTKDLMVKIFSESVDPSIIRAEAMRQAMLDLMENDGFERGDYRFSYAHPLFWAPFSLVGDGGL